MKALSQSEKVTPRPIPILANRGKSGYALVWMSGFTSAMPDEKTAIQTHRILLQHDALDALRTHILSMADDAYLIGHPEWAEIVKEAKSIQ